MNKITFYSDGLDKYREAYKAITPRVYEPFKIEKENKEYRKVEEVSSSSNNPRKKDEPTPYDIYERMKSESALHPINIKEGKSK